MPDVGLVSSVTAEDLAVGYYYLLSSGEGLEPDAGIVRYAGQASAHEGFFLRITVSMGSQFESPAHIRLPYSRIVPDSGQVQVHPPDEKTITAQDLRPGAFYRLLSWPGSSVYTGDVVQFVMPSCDEREGWFTRFSFADREVTRRDNQSYAYARVDLDIHQAELYIRERGAEHILDR
ncbi:MAG: hypothetical protein WC516_03630 [Patescibacteria group bacterium]